MDFPPFRYSPLITPTSIRLIQLQSSPSKSGLLECTIKTLDLSQLKANRTSWNSADCYVALSYTWGNPTSIIEQPINLPKAVPSDIQDRTESLPWAFESQGPDNLRLFNDDLPTREYVLHKRSLPRHNNPCVGSQQESPTVPILVDGCILRVQRNLHDFLQHLARIRQLAPPDWEFCGTESDEYWTKKAWAEMPLAQALYSPIWIDAICINQADMEERVSQVQMMDEMYREASRVFAWLGPPDGFTEDALDALEALYLFATYGPVSGNYNIMDDNPTSKLTFTSFEPEMDIVSWVAIFSFFQRSWFSRAWVAQEAIFGDKGIGIVHGDKIIPWECLIMVTELLEKSGLHMDINRLGSNLLAGQPLSNSVRGFRKVASYALVDRPIREISLGSNLLEGDGITFLSSARSVRSRLRMQPDHILTDFPPLLRVLSLFRNAGATDPRDKVFAFLNIATEQENIATGLVPDYTASVQDVFKRTTQTIMEHTRSLSILSHVQEPEDTKIQGLPLWVPDFSVPLCCTPFDTGDDDVYYRASGASVEAWYQIHDDGTLEVETVMFDAILFSPGVGDETTDLSNQILQTILSIAPDYPIGRFEWVDIEDKKPKPPIRDPTDNKLISEILASWEPAHDSENDDYDYDDDTRLDWEREFGIHLAHAKEMEQSGSLRDALSKENAAGEWFDCPSSPVPPQDAKSEKPHRHRAGKRLKIHTVTRIEALWRTLTGNSLPAAIPGAQYLVAGSDTTYPAPRALGNGFCNWILASLLEMRYLFHRLKRIRLDTKQENESAEDEQTNNALPNAAATRFRHALALWSAVYNEVYIDRAAQDTFDVHDDDLPFPDLDEMEKEEYLYQMAPKFLPCATRIKEALRKEIPEIEIPTTKIEDLQVVLNGLEREQALTHFTKEEQDEMIQFERRMETMVRGRRLFVTHGGLLGLGPQSLFQGEGQRCPYEVHIVKGAKVPFVLRTTPEEGKYKLIGEAYVFGIMDGEIEDMLKTQDWCEYKKIKLG
ncbi:heterokaryon incompatibility protein-domain-containing protein [Podospora australis]|uniref:Heterokaryon incompatibility protein-domain-containing protein n=1 Tax=Podospora australis TaxID=1536484 RepID=A0AAN6WL49_9PEZI|nr:heterokaryon incompatibility protein-domain-containing protein [Podospora australis]